MCPKALKADDNAIENSNCGGKSFSLILGKISLKKIVKMDMRKLTKIWNFLEVFFEEISEINSDLDFLHIRVSHFFFEFAKNMNGQWS